MKTQPILEVAAKLATLVALTILGGLFAAATLSLWWFGLGFD